MRHLSILAIVMVVGCGKGDEAPMNDELAAAAAETTAAATQPASPAQSSPSSPATVSAATSAAQATPAQAAEIRAYVNEVRPLLASCAESVTVRGLIIEGSGAQATVMRSPPTSRSCNTLRAEVMMWEMRLSALGR